jgi:hypothetical protein
VILPSEPFTAIKYGIYLLLAGNLALFLHEEVGAAMHTLADPLDFRNVVSAFAQTIDTAAWVVLLLLFELETFVIPDAQLQGRLRWVLHGVRATCYLFIIYAFYGYLSLSLDLYAARVLPNADICALAASGAALLLGTGDYVGIAADNCSALAPAGPIWQLTAAPGLVVAGEAALDAARRLAWTDVINAGTWLLIVLLLEIDVRLQLRGLFRGWTLRLSEALKAMLYSVLLACAIYWGFAGSFLDFWDAFLWLLAFVLIELNVIEWQAETES